MRLLFPAFVHRDATHLFFNLNSIIESGLIMEPHMGAAPFLLDVATMTAMSHGFYILISWLEKELLEIPSSYYFYGNPFGILPLKRGSRYDWLFKRGFCVECDYRTYVKRPITIFPSHSGRLSRLGSTCNHVSMLSKIKFLRTSFW